MEVNEGYEDDYSVTAPWFSVDSNNQLGKTLALCTTFVAGIGYYVGSWILGIVLVLLISVVKLYPHILLVCGVMLWYIIINTYWLPNQGMAVVVAIASVIGMEILRHHISED